MLLRAYRRGFTTRRGARDRCDRGSGGARQADVHRAAPGDRDRAGASRMARSARGPRRRATGARRGASRSPPIPIALYALLNVTAWHRGSPTAGGVAGATNSTLPGGGVVTLRRDA